MPGTQSGKIEDFAASKVNFKRCLFSLSRALLFPQEKETRHKNSKPTKAEINRQQKEHACFWRDQINLFL